MPDLFSPELLSEESRDEIRSKMKDGPISSNSIAQILREDINFVGEGGRVVVAALENDPDKLAAVSFKEMSPEEVKAIYYNQKILKILFPDNFPTIHAGYGRKDGKGVSVTFRERVEGSKFSVIETQNMIRDANEKSKDDLKEGSFAKVIIVCKELGIPFFFDKNNRNYMKSVDGDDVYVDTINFRWWTEEMKTSLIEYLKKQEYSEKDIGLANAFVDRLMLLK